MYRLNLPLIVLLGFVMARFAVAQTTAPAAQSAEEAAYTRAINDRAAKHVAALNLTDTAKATKVQDMVAAQYRNLRNLHDARDAKIKALPAGAPKEQADQIKADSATAVKALHDQYLAALATELSAEQIDVIKDQMTYGRGKLIYNGLVDMLPSMTDEQKAKVKEMINEGRELAMDGGSSQEKHAILDKYVGRINNYLSREGYDLKKASEERNARNRATTRPSN
jgi:hypothetical protein